MAVGERRNFITDLNGSALDSLFHPKGLVYGVGQALGLPENVLHMISPEEAQIFALGAMYGTLGPKPSDEPPKPGEFRGRPQPRDYPDEPMPKPITPTGEGIHSEVDRPQMLAATESNYPNPFLDIGKYTPKAPTSKPEPSPALKFWEHPSPKVIPIREGEQDRTKLAGDVVPLPIAPGMGAAHSAWIENLKRITKLRNPTASDADINRAMNKALGGGADVLPIAPGK